MHRHLTKGCEFPNHSFCCFYANIKTIYIRHGSRTQPHESEAVACEFSQQKETADGTGTQKGQNSWNLGNDEESTIQLPSWLGVPISSSSVPHEPYQGVPLSGYGLFCLSWSMWQLGNWRLTLATNLGISSTEMADIICKSLCPEMVNPPKL